MTRDTRRRHLGPLVSSESIESMIRAVNSPTESNNSASDGHHPEHAVGGDTVRCSGQDAADDDHRRCKDDGSLAA